MSDPVIYKILAVVQIVTWTAFLGRYGWRLYKGRLLHREATFAWALLSLGVSMVLYGLATVLRQFLGLDYFGRDAVRIVASIGLLATAAAFHRAISKWAVGDHPRRRSTDHTT